MTAAINPSTRLAAVLGWPIAHSRSPQIMNAAFSALSIDAVLVAIGVPPDGLTAALQGLRSQRALGASITIPHKLAALALCDEVTDAAITIGAVNCIQFDGDRMIGHNTDEGGFTDSLDAAGFSWKAPRVVLLGAGGAARAVAYAMRHASVEVIARRPEEATWTTALPWTADALRASFVRADLVVDCTSLGLGGPDEIAVTDALPLELLGPAAWVATLVYHRQTRLLERARAIGRAIVDGRGMLVHQAARSFAIWTGRAAPVDVMTRALDDDLRGT